MTAVVGRERELAAVERFLSDALERFSVLSLEGEAGIGKTTVWRARIRAAEAGGFRVLTCRPAEFEAKLAFAALGDMLNEVDHSELGSLPEPQRVGLEVALLRVGAGSASPSPRVVGVALVSLLASLARAQPVLLAVDDVQWLDAASATVLEFALRRMTHERVGVLVSQRLSEPRLLRLRDVVEPGQLLDVTLGPMSLAALHHVLEGQLAVVPPRSLLIRIRQASAGNPLFALEIARLLADVERPPVGQPLPVPADVETLVRGRIARLPPQTCEVLLAAAALRGPREETLRAAFGGAIDRHLAPAESRGIASLERGTVTFAHPLFAAAVYESASTAQRRDVHRRLANVVDEVEERARHLALAAPGPDESVANVLEDAARNAAGRGAPAGAAELLELAVDATPPGRAARQRREVELALQHSAAGEFRRATDLLERLVEELQSSNLRARALLALSEIEYWTKSADAACGRVERALVDAEDPLLRARCHATLGISAIHDVGPSVREADAALELPEGRESEDRETLCLALCTRVRGNLFLGNGFEAELLERAVEVERLFPAAIVQDRPSFKQGQLLKYVDDLEGSRARLEQSCRAALEIGDESSALNALLNLSVTECWAGNGARARAHAERAVEVAAELGAHPAGAASYRAYVDAHLGNVEAVRDAATIAEGSDEPVVRALALRSLALVELAAGDHAAAGEHVCQALSLFDGAGFAEPAIMRVHGDAIEAALAVGDVERAERLLEPFEAHARRVPVPWSLAVSARCRALVSVVRGDAAGGERALGRALAAHERCPVPFELARTLLAAGEIRRRNVHRRAAADAFDRAAAIFGELGAVLWEARATAERRRIPIRRRASEDLTATEERVSALAATGRTNREVAQALFISPKTVEANLARVYRKLGIASRAELGATMAERASGETVAKP